MGLYINDFNNTQLILTSYVQFARLRNTNPLGQSVSSLSMVGVALIGVREVLDVENLELAILFDKG